VRCFGWDELDAAEVESLYPALVHDAHVERFLTDHGVVLSQAGRACFLSAVLRMFLDALGTLERRAAGNWSPDKRVEMLPPPMSIETLKRVDRRAGSKPMELFEAYCLDKQSAPSSVARRRIVFKTLDALRESIRDAEDAQRWLDSLKTKDRSAHTVRVTYLSAARAVYAWAKRKRLIAVNPFEDCVVEVPRKAQTRATDKAFNDDEVSIVLQAALQVEVRPGQPWDAAKRWVPWLSAYTGARAGELTQLRVKDIDAVRKAILITPDAGPVKNRQARMVPLHSHLVEMGFLNYVQATRVALKSDDAPLFYRRPRQPSSNYRGPAVGTRDRLAAWVRSLGITDPNIQPNHAWRHTFLTLAARIGIEQRMRDAIAGHAPRTEADKYVHPSVEAMAEAIKQFPRYTVAAPSA
jgi:integrase